jgi:hypothetical protein
MKHAQQLLITDDHNRFVWHPNQQPPSEAHVRKIAESMRQYGFLPSKPIQVCRHGNQLTVIDGHHRLEAATLLRIPVYYVIEPPSHISLIGAVNVTVRKWSNLSFAKFHAENGSEDYQTLLEYEKDGVPLHLAASMLAGESAHSGNAGRTIQTGKFKVKTTKIIDWICSVIKKVKGVAPEIQKRAYIEALSMCWYVDEVDRDQLVHKMLNMPKAIVRAADRKQALSCLEEAYNFKRSLKVNLSFLAQEKMKERCLMVFKK